MPLLQKAYLGATPLFRQEDWFASIQFDFVDSSAITTVTANSSAHTKGSWTEVIASTSGNASLLTVFALAVVQSGTNTATLLDIATGASGSETAVISNLAIGGASAQSAGGVSVNIPLQVPSGTRLSARIQSVVTGGKNAQVQLFAIDAGDYATAPTSVDVIGSSTITSEGLSMSGASGTWVEATASTSQDYRAIACLPSTHNAAISNYTTEYDIGVGASGSEAIFGRIRCYYGSSETCTSAPPYTSLFGRSLPSGSRLAIKHDLAANPDRYGITLIGIP